jgi:hypothetical protein
MVLSCQIQTPDISLSQNVPDAHEKAGWLSAPVYTFWKGKYIWHLQGIEPRFPDF